MPGIVGMLGQRLAEECESRVKTMVASMEHEHFYRSGVYAAPEMGVYTGWVAHENSFAAGQVFFNEQQDVALIFSGECFVDLATLTGLKRKGHTFEKNKSDWLVHLYEDEGDRFFEKLNGLFSGLLIDKRQRKVFLFNDRYGIERIYWHEANGDFYFASEAKALLRILPELREFDTDGVAQFLTFGCALEGRTLFRGINILPGGSLWCFENGKCHKRKYFSPELWEAEPALSAESYTAEFQETFQRILPRYFESESRIGISLTAGLDSRMIMACLPQTVQQPVCYTFSGKKGLTLDDRLAARVAETCGLEHRLLRIDLDFFSDFAAHADRTVYLTDGCFGVTGAHEIYLNGQARHLAPVRVTGNFGSEILRGVSTFQPVGLSPQLFSPEISSALSSLEPSAAPADEHPVTFAAFREIPWNLFGSLAAGRTQTIFRTPYLDNQIVALAYQCPSDCRTSPQPALSIVRNNNADLSAIPTDMGRGGNSLGLVKALRRGFSKVTFKLDYLNNEGLPHALSPLDPLLRRLSAGTKVLGLHKYLHYRSWFGRELSGYLHDVVKDAQVRRTPFWNRDFLGRMVSEHIGGRRNYVREINAVLTLEAVERLLFRELPDGRSDLRHPDSENSRKEPLLTG